MSDQELQALIASQTVALFQARHEIARLSEEKKKLEAENAKLFHDYHAMRSSLTPQQELELITADEVK